MSGAIQVDDTHVKAVFRKIPQAVMARLVSATTALRLKMEGLVKQKLSGEVLHVVTGNLRRSIYSYQNATDTSVEGVVAQSADVPYGRIHELGGQTRPHLIVPVKANVLAFMAGGKLVFARAVNHPGSNIPARPYLRPSLAEMVPEIRAAYQQAAAQGLLDAQ